jgi:uncharacterized membrane protein YhhN
LDINFKLLLLIYIPVSLVASWCSSFNRKWFYFIKPVPVTLLIIYMIVFILTGKIELVYLMLAMSLIFCLAGDVLLLFDKLFMIGVASFLFGHITYSVAFFKNGFELPVFFPICIITAGIAMGIYISQKMDKETRKKILIPVWIYIIAISTMLVLAINRDYVVRSSFSLLSVGAVSFFLSDAILSYNRFVRPFKLAGLLIHVTYYGGQILIVAGMLSL